MDPPTLPSSPPAHFAIASSSSVDYPLNIYIQLFKGVERQHNGFFPSSSFDKNTSCPENFSTYL